MRASSGLLSCVVIGGMLGVAPPALAMCRVNGDLFYMHKNDESQHLWGEAVNLASRMESQGRSQCIQITPGGPSR
jgi:hypothetical protein